MSATSLRPYQEDAIQAVLAARRRGLRRMLVCLPTGAGKTVIFAELARRARRPVLVLAHRAELLEQAAQKLQRALGPSARVGVEQASRRAPPDARAVVASLRSLREGRLDALLARRDFGLVVYDECHHAPAEDNQRVLRQLGAFEPDWDGTLLGFTATPQRGDGLALRPVFQEIVYHRTLLDLVEQGWLVPLRGFRIATQADLRAVHPRGADLDLDELALAVDIQERNALVARSIQELARDRRTIVFCVTVAHARNLARALNGLHLPAGMVHGQMPPDERARTLELFRTGALRALTNVGVLTEGFDDPGVSCVAMARPTRSDGLYAQCVGRGTRLHPGKTDCLVLDFVDLSELRLCSLPDLGGLPPGLDLQGERLDRAAARWQTLLDQSPGLEIEPGRITLEEIQERAAAFDPLRQSLQPEVRAISPLAWTSLGRRGIALHLHWRRGQLAELAILDQGGRGRRWWVTLDGRELARFSTLEEAVQAADFEVERRGPATLASARAQAPWRAEAPPPALAAACPPGLLHGEALQWLAWQRRHRPSRGPSTG